MTAPGHIPVMLNEVLAALAPAGGETYLDGTFGGGGYAQAILSSAHCQLIALDRDLDAIARADALAAREPRLQPLLGRFGRLDEIANDAGIQQVDGVVLDIGVSSFHLDEADRGFSFQKDGPLDMRMGQDGPTAADVVNSLPDRALADIIFRLGEEAKSRRIAKAVTARRVEAPFERTADLANVVEVAVGGRRGAKTHPATRTFQAIRMFINNELGELADGLLAAERLLAPGGRLVVVTFHSLEDRIVKTFLRARSGGTGGGSRHVPESGKGAPPSFRLDSRKAVIVSPEEAEANPRARSAKLRVAARTDAPPIGGVAWDGAGLPALGELEISK